MEMISVLFQYHAIIVFVVPVSYQILSLPIIKSRLEAKFLVPLFVTFLICICFFYEEGLMSILQNTVEYAGKSIILNEVYKNVFKRREK